jgi:serine/threonine protein kinase
MHVGEYYSSGTSHQGKAVNISSRTPEGQPHRCPICQAAVRIEPSVPPGDAPCPNCGHLLWFPSPRFGRPPGGGAFRGLERIGAGTFGEVWRGEGPGGMPVAIKVIFRPIDHEEAQREIRALEVVNALRHPRLAQTHAFYSESDRLVMVMELADGNLRDRAKECRKAGLAAIPADELLGYFKEAAEGLDYLHQNKPPVLHRDIKPDNLLLFKPKDQHSGVGAHLKLGDFGLVRVWESQRLQASGAGTPAYMAPEVWNGQISKHSDQYSLAITYAELRRGKPVLSGTNMYELMTECLTQDPDLAGLGKAERQVLRKALAKVPKQRYPTCSKFVLELERARPAD